MQCETFAEKWKNTDMVWAQHIKIDNAQNLKKYPNKANQTIFARLNSEKNLFYLAYSSILGTFELDLPKLSNSRPILTIFNFQERALE